MSRHTILVIDDEEFIRLNLQNILQEENQVILLDKGHRAMEVVGESDISLVLLDLNLQDMHGLEVLKQLKQQQPDLLVIIITGYASVESAVEAIKLGAYDYIKKPFKADAIKLIVKLALETQDLKKRVRALSDPRTQRGPGAILGESEEVAQVRHRIQEFAKYDSATVLVTGESGTGKELVARALHNLSPRQGYEFVEINCASIPENLLESELFGHEKGAFTNAHATKKGLLEKAHHGTLFLDEMGEMSPALQAKLLRVMEHKTFRRLGGTNDITVDVRIIAATNKDLKAAIEAREFREDLYYRLNVLRIDVPPLRQRHTDILILAQYFLDVFSRKFNKPVKTFSDAANRELLQYGWPGNVRELKNIVERICILREETVIEPFHLPGEIMGTPSMEGGYSPKRLLGQVSLEEMLVTMEAELIRAAMAEAGDNISKAARILQIPRETLRYRLSRLGIKTGEN